MPELPTRAAARRPRGQDSKRWLEERDPNSTPTVALRVERRFGARSEGGVAAASDPLPTAALWHASHRPHGLEAVAPKCRRNDSWRQPLEMT